MLFGFMSEGALYPLLFSVAFNIISRSKQLECDLLLMLDFALNSLQAS